MRHIIRLLNFDGLLSLLRHKEQKLTIICVTASVVDDVTRHKATEHRG